MPPEFTADSEKSGNHNRGAILAPSPVLLLLTFGFGVVLDRFERVEVLPRPWNLVAGSLSFVAGTGLFVGAIRTMRRAGTGPSHDDETPGLITDGVFQYSRNPIYLGNCLQYVGLSLLYNSLSAIVMLVPTLAYLDRVVKREEAHLESRFGGEFETYRETVRRWL